MSLMFFNYILFKYYFIKHIIHLGIHGVCSFGGPNYYGHFSKFNVCTMLNQILTLHQKRYQIKINIFLCSYWYKIFIIVFIYLQCYHCTTPHLFYNCSFCCFSLIVPNNIMLQCFCITLFIYKKKHHVVVNEQPYFTFYLILRIKKHPATEIQ